MKAATQDIGYVRAKRKTVCRSCQKPISVGELIARPASGLLVAVEHRTKAKWSHPKCLERQLALDQVTAKEAARLGYAMRRSRKVSDHG